MIYLAILLICAIALFLWVKFDYADEPEPQDWRPLS